MSTGSSGSSSNGSLPPLSRESNDEHVPLTFYCHQCNSKFPLIGAKYCCECGAKRRGMGQICVNQTGWKETEELLIKVYIILGDNCVNKRRFVYLFYFIEIS